MGSAFNPYLKRKGHDDTVFNLVTASGHGKDASLCFFERTVRPEVTTTSALEDAVQFWSVGRHDKFSIASSPEDLHHRYLIIAKEMSTLVLELENDMVELEEPLFLTSETTVAAGEMANGSVVVQVAAMSIVLVCNGQQLEMVNIESNFPVVAASINDPFITLLTQNGRILLYRLVPTQHTCVETGVVGWKDETREDTSNIHLYPYVKKEESTDDRKDDIDELLYGDEQTPGPKPEKKAQKRKAVYSDQDGEKSASKLETDVQDPNCIMPPTGFISDVQLVYMVKKFNQLHEVIYDDAASAYDEDHPQFFSTGTSSATQAGDGIKSNLENSVVVKMEEIVMELTSWGWESIKLDQFYLLLSTIQLFFYEMFGYDDGIEGHLAIRFSASELFHGYKNQQIPCSSFLSYRKLV
uniref:Cleavage/polyadenylation specificity factor A subunit N-terminal domain-containing protein n=1 Tax=Ditylenchus dipsaci TaxID=166011 RepID=A0A915DJB3_9BILA